MIGHQWIVDGDFLPAWIDNGHFSKGDDFRGWYGLAGPVPVRGAKFSGRIFPGLLVGFVLICDLRSCVLEDLLETRQFKLVKDIYKC